MAYPNLRVTLSVWVQWQHFFSQQKEVVGQSSLEVRMIANGATNRIYTCTCWKKASVNRGHVEMHKTVSALGYVHL